MEMTETTISEALGVEATTAVTNTDTSTTADGNTAANNTPSGQPAVTENQNLSGSDDDNSDSSGDSRQTSNQDSDHSPQSPEENARYAAARRQAEAQRDKARNELAAERERSKRLLDESIASLGIMNPYTGQPITDKAGLDAYNNARASEAKTQFMTNQGLNEQQYQQLINSLPEVQAALRAKAESERAAAEYRNMQAKSSIESQLGELQKLDPDIKSIDDLAKMENYDAFYGYVKKGNTLADAYRLANFSKLLERNTAAEKQRNLNAAAGKQHMAPVASTTPSGLDAVPAETMSYYRMLMPDASDEEIAKEYQSYLKHSHK